MQADLTTRVFIADDSAAIRGVLKEMLGHVPNASVIGEAATPQEAIDSIRISIPDVVILDLHLLGGSGLTVLRAVHPELPDTMFVVLTNHPTPQYRRLCLEAGATHFLDKSNEFIKVVELIRAGHAPGVPA